VRTQLKSNIIHKKIAGIAKKALEFCGSQKRGYLYDAIHKFMRFFQRKQDVILMPERKRRR